MIKDTTNSGKYLNCQRAAGFSLRDSSNSDINPPRAAGLSPRGLASSENAETASGTPVITRIKDAKFKQVVRPGDVLDVEVTIDEKVNDVFFMTGRLRVGGKLAVRVEFAATLLES